MCDDCIISDLDAEMEDLKEKLTKALNVISRVEFVYDKVEDCNRCPWCLEYELIYLPNRSHRTDCIWVKTLEECDPNYIPDPLPEPTSTMCNP